VQGACAVMGGNLSIIRSHEQSSPVTDYNDDDDNSLSLTEQERQLIDSTWKQLTTSSETNEEELGVRVFIRIFELEPSIRDAFPNFAGLHDREMMRRNVLFRCHGNRFVRAVRSVVDNLDSLGVIAVPNLDLLGRKHRDFHGFRADYLRIYEAAMEDVWREALGRKFDKTTCRAWRKVFKLITSTVLHGYEQKRTCPAVETTPTVAGATVVTPNDINGSLSCNDSNADCGLSS